MLSQNKNRIAYLSALTLLFSYAEMLLPRFVPFFRLGLGNIAILLAFDLSLPSFLLLTVFKAITASLMAGTLFSPFFLISLGQSVVSGFLMYLMAKLNVKTQNRLFSVYGISTAGAAISSVIQIALSSLYLGQGTAALLGPMLLFSIFSGIVTAVLSQILHIPETTPELIRRQNQSSKNKTVIFGVLILAAVVAIFMINNLIILCIALAAAVVLQIISGRKFMILPHISLWLFVVISCIFVPNGKVLYKIGSFSITQGALMIGIVKALKLSAVTCLSQCAASLRLNGENFISLILAYFSGLNNEMRTANGNLVEKLKHALSVNVIHE